MGDLQEPTPNYRLWKHLADNHNLYCTESELNDILDVTDAYQKGRADERERCIEAVKNLDKSDETILATYTRNFNKGVNIGIELAIHAIKRLGETENGN